MQRAAAAALGLAALTLLSAAPAEAAGPLVATVTDHAGRPLGDAVVTVHPAAGVRGYRPRAAVIDQRDRDFVPWVSVVEQGATVTFPNRDKTMHHVYSFSPAKRFEMKVRPGDAGQTVLFDRPGVVAVGCNIHDWMQAFIFVSDTPYHAKTGSDGRAQITGLPEGELRIAAWHPYQRAELPPQTVTASAGATQRISIVLDVVVPRRRHKPPEDAGAY
jgi:plastocyanin